MICILIHNVHVYIDTLHDLVLSSHHPDQAFPDISICLRGRPAPHTSLFECERNEQREQGYVVVLSEPTFRPSGKTQCFATTNFCRTCILFLLSLSLLLSSLFCSFLTLPTSAFPSVHIVRSLTSTLPSIKDCIYIYIYI